MLYLLTLFLNLILFSAQDNQKFSVNGVVVDSLSRKPLENVIVFFPTLKQGTTTNQFGEFVIEKIPSGSHSISFQILGYKIQTKTITVDKNIFLKQALEEQHIHLGEVHIIGEKSKSELDAVGKPITSISLREIEMLRGQTVSNLLKEIPGVSLYSLGPSIAKPVIRGFHSQRIVVINAGIPIEGQQWGGEHAPEVDPFSPSNVEVIKGASSVEYGNGAIGGVIKFDPRNFRTDPGIGGTVIGNLFSNNRQFSGSLILDGALENLPIGWQAQLSGRYAGDSKTPDYYITNTGFRELNGSVGFKYGDENNFIETYTSHFGSELGIYSGSHIGSYEDMLRAIERGKPEELTPFTYAIDAPSQKINHNLFSLHSALAQIFNGTLDLTYGWQQNERQEFDSHLQSRETPSIDMTLTTHNIDLKFKHMPIGYFYGVIGIGGSRQGNVNEGKTQLIPNHRAYTTSLYFVEHWKTENTNFSFGARYGNESRKIYFSKSKEISSSQKNYETLNGMFSTEYNVSERSIIEFTLSSATRAPSSNELYSSGVHHGSAQFEVGNENLKTEKSIAGDFSYHFNFQNIHSEINFFKHFISNYIYLNPRTSPTVTISGTFPTFEYLQNNVEISGFDGSLQYEVTEDFSVKGDVAIVTGKLIESGEFLYGMPANKFRLTSHLHLFELISIKDLSADITLSYTAKQKNSFAKDYLPPPNSYSTIDISFNGRIDAGTEQIKIQIGVNNILNTKYREYLNRFRYFIDNPGRDISIKLLFSF